MHEVGVVEAIVELVTERCEGARVTRVVLEIGALTAVLPDAVRFCFDAVTEGTLLDGATLEILEQPGVGRCTRCGVDTTLVGAIGLCPCGSTDLEWVRGHELRVREMELAR